MIKLKKVTKENMQTFIALRKKYYELEDENKTKETDTEMQEIFEIIEDFIVNVINKDKLYYSKLSEYGFSNEDLRYCMY